MSNGRPKLQHSNITYYAIQQRSVTKSPIIEKLPDPEPIQYESLSSIMEANDSKQEKDIFCPPDLTKVDDGLYYLHNQPTKETQ
jgi:hypothetical protein